MPVMDSRWQALRISDEPILVLAKSGVAVAHTGNTNETTFATITIPGGTIGPNGQVEVEALFSNNNSAGAKTLRIRLGGFGLISQAVTTTLSYQTRVRIANRNASNSQVAFPAPASTGTSGAPTALAVDTSANVSLTITGQLAVGTDSITLESYLVRVIPGA